MKYLVLVVLVHGAVSFAAKPKSRPCDQVRKACEDAGFVQGAAKAGNGLWLHCLNPIMKGTPQPKGATKPLPQVDNALVEACKAMQAGKKKPNK